MNLPPPLSEGKKVHILILVLHILQHFLGSTLPSHDLFALRQLSQASRHFHRPTGLAVGSSAGRFLLRGFPTSEFLVASGVNIPRNQKEKKRTQIGVINMIIAENYNIPI